MANRVINLTAAAETQLNVRVAEYNAANGTVLSLTAWITLHLRELAIERQLVRFVETERAKIETDHGTAIVTERDRLLGTL